MVTLDDYQGKKLVLSFYPKDNTPPCTASACNLRDNYEEFLNKGFSVLAVSADSIESHRVFAEKNKLPFPLLADTDKKMIRSYDVWGLKELYGREFEGIVRTSFVIDGEGIIQKVLHNVSTSRHAQQVMK